MEAYIKYLTNILCVIGISAGIYFLKKRKKAIAILCFILAFSALVLTVLLLLKHG